MAIIVRLQVVSTDQLNAGFPRTTEQRWSSNLQFPFASYSHCILTASFLLTQQFFSSVVYTSS
jgi:hypothetical protein